MGPKHQAWAPAIGVAKGFAVAHAWLPRSGTRYPAKGRTRQPPGPGRASARGASSRGSRPSVFCLRPPRPSGAGPQGPRVRLGGRWRERSGREGRTAPRPAPARGAPGWLAARGPLPGAASAARSRSSAWRPARPGEWLPGSGRRALPPRPAVAELGSPLGRSARAGRRRAPGRAVHLPGGAGGGARPPPWAPASAARRPEGRGGPAPFNSAAAAAGGRRRGRSGARGPRAVLAGGTARTRLRRQVGRGSEPRRCGAAGGASPSCPRLGTGAPLGAGTSARHGPRRAGGLRERLRGPAGGRRAPRIAGPLLGWGGVGAETGLAADGRLCVRRAGRLATGWRAPGRRGCGGAPRGEWALGEGRSGGEGRPSRPGPRRPAAARPPPQVGHGSTVADRIRAGPSCFLQMERGPRTPAPPRRPRGEARGGREPRFSSLSHADSPVNCRESREDTPAGLRAPLQVPPHPLWGSCALLALGTVLPASLISALRPRWLQVWGSGDARRHL